MQQREGQNRNAFLLYTFSAGIPEKAIVGDNVLDAMKFRAMDHHLGNADDGYVQLTFVHFLGNVFRCWGIQIEL